MKMDVGVRLQSALSLRLKRIQIVKDDVKLFADIFGNDFIHEVQGFAPSAPGVVPGSHLTLSSFSDSPRRSGRPERVRLHKPILTAYRLGMPPEVLLFE